MNDENQGNDTSGEPKVSETPEGMGSDELTVLKQRAKLMGLVFSNNIGIQALRQKIEAKMAGEIVTADAEADNAPAQANPLTGEDPVKDVNPVTGKPLTTREILMRDQMKLVRLRITNMDPKKKELPGEILTVGNEFLGTVSKYIPFGEVTDNGYHVPFILYTMMKDRKFLNIRTTKTANGQSKVSQNWASEFALEILPPLTRSELDKLATAQAAAGVFAGANEESL